MIDLTQADDADFHDSIDRFQAALSSAEIEIPQFVPQRILVALDRSNQDLTSERLAADIAGRFGAELLLLYGYEGGVDADKEAYLEEQAAALRSQGLAASRVPRGEIASGQRSFEQIQHACQHHHGDVVVVCAPYFDDFTQLGGDSVGTNLDMLMGRVAQPLLVIREPRDEASACLGQVLLTITPYVPQIADAAGWALALARTAIRILAVVDEEIVQSFDHLLKDARDLDPQELAGLRQPVIAGLVAALQRQAAQRDLGCRVTVRSGETTAETIALAESEGGVIFTACPRRPSAVAFQRVQALTRSSRHPVWIA